MSEKIRILFDDGPGPVGGRFIEIENEKHGSISFGEWVQEGDCWYLEFLNLEAENAALKLEVAEYKDVLTGLREGGLIHDVTIARHREVGGSYGESAVYAVDALLGADDE